VFSQCRALAVIHPGRFPDRASPAIRDGFRSVIARLVRPSAAQRAEEAPLTPRGSTIPSDLAREWPTGQIRRLPCSQSGSHKRERATVIETA
jgi:hypothetical protein